MKTRWYKDAIIYQIYPRSFCDSNGDGIGDIQGIISKLDHLAELGVNAVWLSPCYSSPNDDNGYDISDYRDIMSDFGTMTDWELMVKEMHARGIKLIMDLVVNHSSDEHFWFKESRKSLDNPYRDYYIWRKGKNNGKKPPNNWKSNFFGSAWEKDNLTDEYYLHLFSKKQPDLNWDNPKLRQEIVDICNFWLERGVDGFRCDVIPYISKREGLPNGKPTIALCGKEHYVIGQHWMEYIAEINQKSWSNFDTLIVGECALTSFDKILEISDERNPYLDTSFSFDIVTSDIIGKPKIKKMKKIFDKFQNVPPTCWTSNFLENHDQPRSIPRFAQDGEFRYLSATMLATMNLFLRGTPYIYQGEEIGMTNANFKNEDYRDIMSINALKIINKLGILKKVGENILRKKARDNARTPMQWSDAPNAGFTMGKPWMRLNNNYKAINVEADKHNEQSIFKYYQHLIMLRKSLNNIISNGVYTDYSPANKQVFQYSRQLENKMILTQINFTSKHIKAPKLNFNAPKLNFNALKFTRITTNYPIENISDSESTSTSVIINSDIKPYQAEVYLIEF